VFAVDIDDAVMARLRKRLQEDGIENVTIVKGSIDDPKLPDAALDAALIVNAYHEMEQHQLILAALRRALKPDGRLVIVEPVTPSRRGRSRAEEGRITRSIPSTCCRTHALLALRSWPSRIPSHGVTATSNG
jgi:ubiquinone/menaquinone biosynthesis C-methylase UbiE